ncbi:hypothetical protein BC835DRAFT_1414451 [Cytidiella melzeri]|nr:hypothetical protein BC835DRAFT_1414451 [Cytidiella melzeri]
MPSNLLTYHFRTVFEDVLTPVQQLQAVNSLKDYILELQHGTDEQRRELDVISDDDVDSGLVIKKVNAALEKCYWQLVIFLRSSRPSRISEAEPYLRVLLSSPTVVTDPSDFHRINASLHLAGSLTNSAFSRKQFSYCRTRQSRSQFDEALSLFSHSFALYDTPTSASISFTPPSGNGLGLSALPSTCLRRRCLPPKTELWARSSYIQLLRHLNQGDEASRQLDLMRAFINSHPYALPTDKYCACIRDLSSEFGLELEVAEEDPVRLVIATDTIMLPVIKYDIELACPVSPSLSFPSSSSTCSDSSACSSPITPMSLLLPPNTQASSKESCDDPSVDESHLEVPLPAYHP